MLIRELELLYLTFNCVPWEESPSLGFNFFIHKMVRNVGSLSDGTRSAVSGVQTLGIPLPLNVGWTEMLLLRWGRESWWLLPQKPYLALFLGAQAALSQGCTLALYIEAWVRGLTASLNERESRCWALCKTVKIRVRAGSWTVTSGGRLNPLSWEAPTLLITDPEAINVSCF